MADEISVKPKQLRNWLKAAYLSGAGKGIDMMERTLDGEEIETEKELDESFQEWVEENAGTPD